jgi:methanol dehydrogenase (cytochrome c) subunit 2
MKTYRSFNRFVALVGGAAVLSLGASFGALAYDGQHCKEAGVCWEAQPNMPETLAGSKYDVKGLEDPHEVAKQGRSEKEMDERNAKRVANFQKTGKWVYDVDQISQ